MGRGSAAEFWFDPQCVLSPGRKFFPRWPSGGAISIRDSCSSAPDTPQYEKATRRHRAGRGSRVRGRGRPVAFRRPPAQNHSAATLLRRHGRVVPTRSRPAPQGTETRTSPLRIDPWWGWRAHFSDLGLGIVDFGFGGSELGRSSIRNPESKIPNRFSPSSCGGRPACQYPPHRRSGRARLGPRAH